MRDLLICICLAAVTAGVYARTWNMQFVNYDDEGYVYENPHVMNGLSWPGVKWAFETSDLANYHPLTWISFQADASLWGAHPRAMHLENVAIHAIDTVLLFLLLRTAGTWPAALAAAIFGVHPLHVESVAWISERKDLLSGCFFLLATIAYMEYAAAKRKWPAYSLMLAFLWSSRSPSC
jgi:protein O-mannosyl-transferase